MQRWPWREVPAQSLLCRYGQQEAKEEQAHGSHAVVAQSISDILDISQRQNGSCIAPADERKALSYIAAFVSCFPYWHKRLWSGTPLPNYWV